MATLTVGAGQQFSTLSAAVAASQNGDVIQVQAGTYTNDFPGMITDNITIEGVGGMANFVATQSPPNGKAILDTAANVTVDHLSFSGVSVPDGNGAGIRYENGNLVLTNDSFSNNQDGILAGADPAGSITISNSVFDGNGSGTGYTHNIYIGDVGSFTITNSLLEGVSVGHELKSRAENNTVTGNVIADGPNGTGSYDIDFPDGGNNTVSNNTIEKGPNAGNPIMISDGEEGGIHANSSLTVSGNTLIDDAPRASSLGVANDTGASASVTGNQIYGLNSGNTLQGTGSAANNTYLASEPGYSTVSPIQGSTINGGSGSSNSGLVLDVSEDSWQGDAQFTVSVDGQQVGGTYTATASHGAGQTEAFAIPTTLGAGTHDVAISFTNDAYGGSAGADRNLYVDGVAFGGQAASNSSAVLFNNETQDVAVTVPTQTPTPTPAPTPTPTGSGSGLVLDVSEEGWQGDAQFTVSVDGQQVGGTYTATAPHDAGQSGAFAIPVTLTPGVHDVGVSFINDLYGGSPTTDRNLFVDGISLNGQAIPDSTANIWSDTTQNFSLTMPAPAQSSGLVLDMSEDSWQGDAQFTVSLDGQQAGGTYTATAAHGADQTEAFAVPVDLTPGAHDIDVSFINDAYGGSPSADRNLYVDGITLNGQTISGSTATLWSDQTNSFSVTAPDPAPANGLVLDLSEDAWQGDAQFTVSVDGQQVGGTDTTTASHGAGQTQALSVLDALSAGTHQIGLTFLNDSYGGSPSTDRNLYLDGATLNGQALAGSSTILYDNGTFTLDVVIPTTHS